MEDNSQLKLRISLIKTPISALIRTIQGFE